MTKLATSRSSSASGFVADPGLQARSKDDDGGMGPLSRFRGESCASWQDRRTLDARSKADCGQRLAVLPMTDLMAKPYEGKTACSWKTTWPRSFRHLEKDDERCSIFNVKNSIGAAATSCWRQAASPAKPM